jgi:hypothetical protein
MPHQIQITDIRFEKLQDISEDDCIADIPQCDKLIQEHYNACIPYGAKIRNNLLKRRDIFAVLIDKINGKGTWESNPYVVVYEFKLIK